MTIIVIVYTISMIFHAIALYYGLKSLKAGEDIFQDSCPTHIMTSRVEQKYWTVCMGTLSNIFLLTVLPFYVATHGWAGTLGWMEYNFIAFHFLDGMTTMIWHKMTYKEIKSGKLKHGEDF